MSLLRILLVEDELLIGALLAEMLEEMGHTICGIEATEAAAVDAALLHKPDLMIVDGRLARGSGISAIETISRTVAIPHIFVSGDRPHAGQTSTVVLLKPFSQRDLAQAIARTMDAAAKAPRVENPGC